MAVLEIAAGVALGVVMAASIIGGVVLLARRAELGGEDLDYVLRGFVVLGLLLAGGVVSVVVARWLG